MQNLDRRDWMKLLGILAAARSAPAQTTPVAPPRVSKDQIQTALHLIGIEFEEAKLDMMLPNVNRALNNYEELRKIDIPLDTEPATRFYPTRPQTIKSARFVPTVKKPRRFEDLDQLAF